LHPVLINIDAIGARDVFADVIDVINGYLEVNEPIMGI